MNFEIKKITIAKKSRTGRLKSHSYLFIYALFHDRNKKIVNSKFIE